MTKPPVWRSKLILLIASLFVLQCLIHAAIDEHSSEWRTHQEAYATALAEQAREAKTAAIEFPVELRQSYLKHLDLNRVDRCTTCHVGIDNPSFKDAEQPLAAHPGDLLVSHPPDRFGCTICHEGQGRATDKDAAHGHVPHWTKPLLTGDLTQATCAKCHHDDPIPEAPVLAQGRRLIRDLGCTGCHQAGDLQTDHPVGPRLDAIGSKVNRRWLNRWLKDPQATLPGAEMPHYGLTDRAANALAAWLMTFRDPETESYADEEGDYDAGADVYREAQCIVCHVTKLDYADNPVGGDIGPNLLKLGNKVNRSWLVSFFRDPHRFLPRTKMPRYHFSDAEALNLAQYAYEEWVDLDQLDADDAAPPLQDDTPEQVRLGERLYQELGCAGCHELTGTKPAPKAPDLTFIGSAPLHQFSFGHANIRRSLPDFFYTKLKSPDLLNPVFHLPPDGNPAEAIWSHLRPASAFVGAGPLPDGSVADQLNSILTATRKNGLLDQSLSLPPGSEVAQAEWLVAQLNGTSAFDPHRMPDFRFTPDAAKAITIALMSLTDDTVSSRRYEVPSAERAVFNSSDDFGRLERKYRCLSCHSIRDSGDLLASDLTWEGSRVQREWLYHYLNKPYSMRRTITIAMPIFHFPDEESRLMADYMSQVFVDTDIGADWYAHQDEADAERGQALFDAKGCIACHQLHGSGGDVGPSLTTQVPEFPYGTWVGDKLRGGWIYQWLKNPQALLPETIEPNLNLSDQEARDLTAFLLSVKNPEFQAGNEKEPAAP